MSDAVSALDMLVSIGDWSQKALQIISLVSPKQV
jgi:hypothetical protein